jgi:DNA-binding IclR family transcriptional regulator
MGTDRSLTVLKLFTLHKPVWTAEEIARELGVSMSTAYRYVLALEEVGLVTTAHPGKYVLGPGIIKLDRQIQLTDPLLAVARPVMDDISAHAPDGSVVLLCRSFGDCVLCVHQVHTKGLQSLVSYERGRPMPMFRGATARIILAYQPSRLLKKLYLAHVEEVRDSGSGETWEAFRAAMAKLRRIGYAVTHGEVDRGRIGIATALLDEDRQAIGSLSYVVPASTEASSVLHLARILQTGAQSIEAALKNEASGTTPPSQAAAS